MRVKKIFLAFLLLLSLSPVAAKFLRCEPPTDLRDERRRLADWPRFSWHGVWTADYFTGLEKYFNDHFGLRAWVIKKKYESDWLLFGGIRNDLVAGLNNFVFYKQIVLGYTPAQFKTFDRERMLGVFRRLKAKANAAGMELLVVNFPAKELIYSENVPAVWGLESDPAKIPVYQVWEELKNEGLDVMTFVESFRELKKSFQVFTPVEENHCSPEAFFWVMQKVLKHIADKSHVQIEIPADFPKLRQLSIAGGRNYRKANFTQTNYSGALPWHFYREVSWHEAVNPHGPLPETVLLSDSFFQVMLSEFGQVLMPYFRRLVVSFNNSTPFERGQSKFLIVGLSDQNNLLYLDNLDRWVNP